MKLSLPLNWSIVVLKQYAATGPAGSIGVVCSIPSSSILKSKPSSGLGKLFLIKLRSEVIPAPLSVAPQNTGTTRLSFKPSLRPRLISSLVKVPSSKNFSIKSSAPSAAFSIKRFLKSSTTAEYFSGIGIAFYLPPGTNS